jgi:hypothetical protein
VVKLGGQRFGGRTKTQVGQVRADLLIERGLAHWPDRQLGSAARFLGLSCWGVDLAWRWTTERDATAATAENFADLFRLAGSFDPLLRGFTTWEITPDGCRQLVTGPTFPV